MEFIVKAYNDLDNWLSSLPSGDYNVEIDTTGVSIDQFKGNASNPSPFGQKFMNARKGLAFNIKFVIPDEVTDASYCFTNTYDNSSIKSAIITSAVGLTNAEFFFYKNINLASADISGFINVTNTNKLFLGCINLTTVNCTNVSKVTNAEEMFQDCVALSSLDTTPFSNITNAKSMFRNCGSLTTIDGASFNKVTNANNMFRDCVALSSITNPNFASVSNAVNMFYNCALLTSIDSSSFTNVQNAGNMFSGCIELSTIDTTSFTNVVDSHGMFNNCKKLSSVNISPFSKSTDTSNMFSNCSSLSTIIWGNIKPDIYNQMFSGLPSNTITVYSEDMKSWINTNKSGLGLPYYSSIKVESSSIKYVELDNFIENLYGDGLYNLTVDTTGVTIDQFIGNESQPSLFGQKLLKVKSNIIFNLTFALPDEVVDASYCFYSKFNKVPLNVVNITSAKNLMNATSMFEESGIADITITGPHKIEIAKNMFKGCIKLNNVSKVTFTSIKDANSLFMNCKKLSKIDTTKFSFVEDAHSMFEGCENISSINCIPFINVKNASSMFKNCTSLGVIDIRYLKNVNNVSNIFQNCNVPNVMWGTLKPASYDSAFSGIANNVIVDVLDDETKKWIDDNASILKLTNYNTTNKQTVILWSDLDAYIKTLTEPGTYNLEIDTTGAPSNYFYGSYYGIDPSTFGKSFRGLEEKGIYFNLKFDIPESEDSAKNCFSEVNSIKSIKVESATNVTNAVNMFYGCSSLTQIDCSGFTNVTDANDMFCNCSSLTQITGTSAFTNVTNASSMFYNCNSLTRVDTSSFTNVKYVERMFYYCRGLTEIDTKAFTNVTSASNMFYNCSNLTQIDCSGFTNVTNANNMFSGCSSLTRITGTSAFTNVTNAYEMFYGCSSLAEIDTSAFTNVTNASNMFTSCSSLTEIDTKAFTNVTKANSMFYDCSSLAHIDTSAFTNVTNANSMFYDCSSLTELDCSGFTSVTDASWMFQDCAVVAIINFNFTSYNGSVLQGSKVETITNGKATDSTRFYGITSLKSIVGVDFSSVTNASDMFYGCSGLTQVDTSTFTSVTDARSMFRDCSGLTHINTQAFTNVTNANYMFDGCSSLIEIDTQAFTNVTSANNMFDRCNKLAQIDTQYFTNVTSANSMFQDCRGLTEIDTKAFTNVTNASSMFNGCSGLTQITGTSAFTKVTNASEMFHGCSSLAKIDTQVFTNVTYANNMFSGCSSLTRITGTSAFTKVTDAVAIFHGCSNLTHIDTSAFTNVTNANSMFYDCSSLTKIDTQYFTNVIDAGGMFYGCSSLPYIDTQAFTNVTNASSMFYSCGSLTQIDTQYFTNVTYAGYMFYGCSSLTQITGTSAFTNVTNAYQMFQDCSKLTQIDTSAFTNVTNASYMFQNCNSLAFIDCTPFKKVPPSSNYNMFADCTSLKEIYWGDVNISSSYYYPIFNNVGSSQKTIYVTEGNEDWVKQHANSMRLYNYTIKTLFPLIKYSELDTFIKEATAKIPYSIRIDMTGVSADQFKGSELYPSPFGQKLAALQKGNTIYIEFAFPDEVIDASYCFYSHDVDIPLRGVNITSAKGLTNASHLFSGCNEMTSAEVTSLSNVTDASYMFSHCTSLGSVDVSTLKNAINTQQMFYGCNNLSSVRWGALKPIQCENTFIGATSPKKLYITDEANKVWTNENAAKMKLTNYSISVKYKDLDEFIDRLVEPGTYDIDVDIFNEDISLFKSNSSSYQSAFGQKLSKAKEGVYFNLKCDIPSKITDMSYCFYNVSSLKGLSLNIPFKNGTINTIEIFSGCNNLTDMDMSNIDLRSVRNFNVPYKTKHLTMNREQSSITNANFFRTELPLSKVTITGEVNKAWMAMGNLIKTAKDTTQNNNPTRFNYNFNTKWTDENDNVISKTNPIEWGSSVDVIRPDIKYPSVYTSKTINNNKRAIFISSSVVLPDIQTAFVIPNESLNDYGKRYEVASISGVNTDVFIDDCTKKDGTSSNIKVTKLTTSNRK